MFHASHGHAHEQSLRSAAKQLGIVLEGARGMLGCEGSWETDRQDNLNKGR